MGVWEPERLTRHLAVSDQSTLQEAVAVIDIQILCTNARPARQYAYLELVWQFTRRLRGHGFASASIGDWMANTAAAEPNP